MGRGRNSIGSLKKDSIVLSVAVSAAGEVINDIGNIILRKVCGMIGNERDIVKDEMEKIRGIMIDRAIRAVRNVLDEAKNSCGGEDQLLRRLSESGLKDFGALSFGMVTITSNTHSNLLAERMDNFRSDTEIPGIEEMEGTANAILNCAFETNGRYIAEKLRSYQAGIQLTA